jgi:hypothetical protein
MILPPQERWQGGEPPQSSCFGPSVLLLFRMARDDFAQLFISPLYRRQVNKLYMGRRELHGLRVMLMVVNVQFLIASLIFVFVGRPEI